VLLNEEKIEGKGLAGCRRLVNYYLAVFTEVSKICCEKT